MIGQEVSDALDRGSVTPDRLWGANQLSRKRAPFDFDTVLGDYEFLQRQIEYLSGFIIQYWLFAEITVRPVRTTRKGTNLYFHLISQSG